MNVAVFCDVSPRNPYLNGRFGRIYYLHLHGCYLLHAGFFFGWFSTLKMEVIISYETSSHVRNTRRYIPEDGSTSDAAHNWTDCSCSPRGPAASVHAEEFGLEQRRSNMAAIFFMNISYLYISRLEFVNKIHFRLGNTNVLLWLWPNAQRYYFFINLWAGVKPSSLLKLS
jgi:hypothetical protein